MPCLAGGRQRQVDPREIYPWLWTQGLKLGSTAVVLAPRW